MAACDYAGYGAAPGSLFGNSPEFWLNLQQMHDLSKARLELNKTIERMLRLTLVLDRRAGCRGAPFAVRSPALSG